MSETSVMLDQLTEAVTDSGVFRCVTWLPFLSDSEGSGTEEPDALLKSILEAADAEEVVAIIDEASLSDTPLPTASRIPLLIVDGPENVFQDPDALKKVLGEKRANVCMLVGAQVARLVPVMFKQLGKRAHVAQDVSDAVRADFSIRDFVYDPAIPRTVRKGIAGLFKTMLTCTVILSAVRRGERLEDWRADALVAEFAAPIATFLNFVAAPDVKGRFQRLLQEDQERANKAKTSLDQLYGVRN